MKKYLVLENGTVFAGEGFGAERDVMAEIVFTTSMIGYVEALTDTGYRGQAICQTFPLAGNYGVCRADAANEGEGAAALIVREVAPVPSNFRSDLSLDAFLKERNIPGLCGIDTRELTKLLRDNGTMNGAIVSDPASVDMAALKAFKPAVAVTCEKTVVNPDGKYKVALIDLGTKENLVKDLADRDCAVHVFPSSVKADEILAISPAGLVISAGPGDPREHGSVIETLRGLMEKNIPTLGIALGHQVLALANGFGVEKLPYGHRGASQPVRNLEAGKLHITAQNHSYAVVDVDEAVADALFVNVNDSSCEGLVYKNVPAYSLQFQPVYSQSPTDTAYLYQRFFDMMQ